MSDFLDDAFANDMVGQAAKWLGADNVIGARMDPAQETPILGSKRWNGCAAQHAKSLKKAG